MTGKNGGFIYLKERVTSDDFGDDDGNGVGKLSEQFEDGADMRIFMLKYDETEFELINDMAYSSTGNMAKLVSV